MNNFELEMGQMNRFNNDNADTVVLVFFQDAGADTWENDTRNFDRVPAVGEYLTLSRDGAWYEVKAVVHMAFPLDYDAELYCVKVEDKLGLRQSFGK
jgi:hypothetical protein